MAVWQADSYSPQTDASCLQENSKRLSDRLFKNQRIEDATCQMCFHISHGSLAQGDKVHYINVGKKK